MHYHIRLPLLLTSDPGHPLKFEFKGAFSDGVFSGTHGYFNSKGELVDRERWSLRLPADLPLPRINAII